MKSVHLWLFVAGTVFMAAGYVEHPAFAHWSKALMTVGAGLFAVARWDRVKKAPKELE